VHNIVSGFASGFYEEGHPWLKKKTKKSNGPRTQPSAFESWLDSYFSIGANGSTHPHRDHRRFHDISHDGLHHRGQSADPREGGDAAGRVFVATCLAAAVATAVMGLYAKYPIALAPGMGLNAFFAFTIVLTYKYTWQQALWAVFLSGVLFFIVSVLRIREYIIDAIPMNLKLAISAGVGLFLAIIALENAGIVVDHPATLVTLGKLDPRLIASWPAILCDFRLHPDRCLELPEHSRRHAARHADRRAHRHSRSASRSSPASFRCRRRSRRRSLPSTGRAPSS
jgi:hypothetical protein